MDENECPKCEAGLPPWLATFADLMSLLMCFFVLLLSFAEIDAVRFKKMAESMKDAFGVQREIPATEIVMGTSVIKQEFSPSTIPEPSPMDDIRQQTQEDLMQNLKVDEAVMEAVEEKIREEVEQQAEEIKELLQEEIDDELVIVETEESRIIIRIQEKGSFPSGSAKLNPGFLEVMDRISGAVATSPGRVVVAGHTDNIPISTARFRSNWELSSARAVTVLHALLDNPDIDQERVQVEGHADSQPLESNDTAEDRAINRRVEIILERGGTDEVEELLKLQEEGGDGE
ncbi:MAG: type VI secretion system protein TssL [Gammaproteobacteria bacterium]|nr:type VI secretion system protein TssL [Gammaproteobacteria bacterium]